MMVRGRIPTMTLVAVGAAVALAGCGQPAADNQAAPQAGTTSAQSPAPPPSTTTSAPSSEPSPASTSELPAQAPESATRECKAGDLELSLGGGDAGAGTAYKQLKFTNTGDRECTIQGFAGVSYVGGDDGHQIGAPAHRDGRKGEPISLDQGESAVADVGFVNAHNYDPAECKPEDARGLRVYPPHDTASEFVQFEGLACAGDEIPGNHLTIRTVQAG